MLITTVWLHTVGFIYVITQCVSIPSAMLRRNKWMECWYCYMYYLYFDRITYIISEDIQINTIVFSKVLWSVSKILIV